MRSGILRRYAVSWWQVRRISPSSVVEPKCINISLDKFVLTWTILEVSPHYLLIFEIDNHASHLPMFYRGVR